MNLEGKVTLSLISGFWGTSDYPKRFSELRRTLHVSDPGLAKALRRLQSAGVVDHDKGLYYVRREWRDRLWRFLKAFYNDFLLGRARTVSNRLRQFEGVVSVVLFGSVAQGKATSGSDIDLLVVVESWGEQLERDIRRTASELAATMGVSIDVLVISTKGLRVLLKKDLQLLFGILEGYVLLYDRGGVEKSLSAKEREARSKYEYHEEVPVWLPRMR